MTLDELKHIDTVADWRACAMETGAPSWKAAMRRACKDHGRVQVLRADGSVVTLYMDGSKIRQRTVKP